MQKQREAAECGSSILRAGHAIVDLQPLKPDTGADLMSAPNDLQSIIVGEQVPGVMNVGIVVRSSRSDRRDGGGVRPSNGNLPGIAPGNEG